MCIWSPPYELGGGGVGGGGGSSWPGLTRNAQIGQCNATVANCSVKTGLYTHIYNGMHASCGFQLHGIPSFVFRVSVAHKKSAYIGLYIRYISN